MQVLYSDPFIALELHASEGYVRYVRSARPFPGITELAATYEAAERELAAIDPTPLGVLVDVREGPGRNDPTFEAAVGRLTTQLIAGFARKAALVRTAAGRLQVSRVARENRDPGVQVFLDEDQALAFVRR